MAVGNWWLNSGTTSTGGFLAAEDIGDGSITTVKLGASAVTTAKIASANVTSECASTNLLTRTFSVTTPDPAAGANIGSTGFVIFQPTVPVNLTTVRAVPQAAWSATTCGVQLVIYSSSLGTVVSWTATSTTFGETAGEPLTSASVASTAAYLAAGSKLCASLLSVNACDNSPAHRIEVHYTTTA